MSATDRVSRLSPRRTGSVRLGRNFHWRGLILPAVVLVFWQALCAWNVFTPDVMPSPVAVVVDLSRLWTKSAARRHRRHDVARSAWVCARNRLATVIGAIVGYSRQAGDYLDPTLQALKAVPSLAWVPLFILWFGIFRSRKFS